MDRATILFYSFLMHMTQPDPIFICDLDIVEYGFDFVMTVRKMSWKSNKPFLKILKHTYESFMDRLT